MVTVHVQDMSFANATLGSRHSTMISASVNVSYFFHIIPLLFNTINIILLDLAFIYIFFGKQYQ